MIADGSVDLILTKFPLAVKAASIWNLYERIIKNNGVILVVAAQPISSIIVSSNLKLFRYEWIWQKEIEDDAPSNGPLQIHESVLTFYKELPKYNPQNVVEGPVERRFRQKGKEDAKGTATNYGGAAKTRENLGDYYLSPGISNYPKSIIKAKTQEKLFEYLIKTYTDEGDLVLSIKHQKDLDALCQKLKRTFIIV